MTRESQNRTPNPILLTSLGMLEDANILAEKYLKDSSFSNKIQFYMENINRDTKILQNTKNY